MIKNRFRLYRRHRGGRFYIHDALTGKQESLGISDRREARALLHARNESVRQPSLNLQLARTYLAATDPQIAHRCWQTVMDELTGTKHGETRQRHERAMQDRAFDSIRSLPLLQTQAEQLFRVLESGTVCTNVYLRRLHNFALDMNWLPWPVIPRKRWPALRFGEKRAITWLEHSRILDREKNPELHAFYSLLWHLGGSQSDVASLTAEDLDRTNRTLAYSRRKTGTVALIRYGDEAAAVFERLPASGPLFPRLSEMHEKHRAKEFKRRCTQLGIQGVTLHSYRYAWAERAKQAGYPERFAQQALGHNSKAVHRAYARKAQMLLPALEEFERGHE